MTGFVALYLRRLLEHPLRTGLSLTGIGAACALFVAVIGLSGSLTGSIARTAALAGRADVQISGVSDTGFDQQLLSDVERVRGAVAVVPYVQTPVNVGGTRALLLGFDARAAALGRSGETQLDTRLSGPGAPAEGVFLGPALARLSGLRSGGEVGVNATGQRRVTRVLGLLADGPMTTFNRGVVAFAALPVAQQLTGRPDRLDGIYVVAAPAVSSVELERRVADVVGGRAVVSSPRLLGDQAAAAASALRAGLLSVSALALLVAGFVVFNTMNMAALERRREIATLRALGGRRRALLAGFLGEAALVGFVGAVLGTVAGLAVARGLVGRLPTELVAAFDMRIGFIVPWAAVPVALFLGTVLAVLAAATPARRAVRCAPVEAMRPEGVLETHDAAGRARWPAAIGGFTAVIAGIGLALVVGAPAALLATTLFWTGGIVTTFGFAAPLAAGAGWFAARFGTAGRLAAASLARAPRRVFVTASAVAAALALVVAQTGTERNVASSLHNSFEALVDTDLVVTTATPENLAADQLLPDRLATDLRKLSGVARLATGQDAYATIGTERVLLRGVAGDTAIPEFRLADDSARRQVLAGSAVVVTAQFARRQGLRAGASLVLPTPAGPQRLPIVAVVNTFASSAGNVVLSLADLQTWFARPGLTRVEIAARPLADAITLRAAVAAVVGANARVETGQNAARRLEGSSRQIAGAFNAIELIIIVAAGLALFNTLTISVVERRQELGILRAIGTSRRQVRRSIVIEAIAIGTLGADIGFALGIFGHYLAVLSTRQVGGFPVVYQFDLAPLAIAEVAAVVLTVAGSWGPALRSSRLNVIDAIGYE